MNCTSKEFLLDVIYKCQITKKTLQRFKESDFIFKNSGYVQNAATQSQSCVNMLHVMYLWLPMIFNLLITFVLIKLNVEHANKELQKEA